ncbi:MAG: sugar phosphate isomerase/epimerase family protein [Hyphomicrobiales bacterium]
MIGVSPAYFISRFGNRFTPQDVAGGLEELAKMEFNGFQLEVYHGDALKAWVTKGARLVRERSADLGLAATQFVAHFMLKAFADQPGLSLPAAVDQMKMVLDIVERFEECHVVTVPLPAFQSEPVPTADTYRRMFDRLLEKIASLLGAVQGAGRRMALELLPTAVIGATDGFLRLSEGLGSDSLGFNFDTGHAWACKENLYLVPAKLGRRILGTHLCDNFGNENLSLCPGAGSIDWPRLISALKACGYNESWDIEIMCKAENAEIEYDRGKRFIEELTKSIS